MNDEQIISKRNKRENFQEKAAVGEKPQKQRVKMLRKKKVLYKGISLVHKAQ